MICKVCGNVINPGDKTCRYCGSTATVSTAQVSNSDNASKRDRLNDLNTDSTSNHSSQDSSFVERENYNDKPEKKGGCLKIFLIMLAIFVVMSLIVIFIVVGIITYSVKNEGAKERIWAYITEKVVAGTASDYSQLQDSEYDEESEEESDDEESAFDYSIINQDDVTDWQDDNSEAEAEDESYSNEELDEDELYDDENSYEDEADEDTSENDYIIPGSDTRRITEDDLEGLTEFECRLARNEIFARHGRKFDTPEIQEYFNSKKWYTDIENKIPSSEFSESMISKLEMDNANMITEYEKKMGWR